MEKLRIGIIGAGSISHFHMVGYQANSDIAEVTAVCDLNLERAQEFAKNTTCPMCTAAMTRCCGTRPSMR